MTDPLEKITEGKGLVGKIRKWISGFLGYVDQGNRRDADKIMREMIAQRFEEQWSRVSEIQRQLINEGHIEVMDDLEAASIKIRTFVDRIKTASYGYAGFFDAVNIKSEELAKIYEFGTDGLPAAIRHLTGLSQETIDIYNRRDEVILSV
jgi:hypothetical protein